MFEKLNNWFINIQPVSATAKIFLLQNLSVMIKAGLPLADAISTLAEQLKPSKMKNILLHAQEKIREGKTFSEALAPYAKDFGEVFVNMVAAGETSGSLEQVLNNLYHQAAKDHKLATKVRNAMTYPAIISVAMVGIGTFVIFFVLPNITKMFTDMKVQLPLPTKILIGVANFVTNNGLIVFPTVFLLLYFFVRWTKSKSGSIIWHSFLLKTPIVGPVIKKINIARLASTLCSLLQTDIAIPEALRITSTILGNHTYKLAMLEASEKVKKGRKLAEIFREYPDILTPIIIQMVTVGEETGALDEVLKNMADFYQDEVEQTMENLPIIIEPILMLVMGLGVAGIAVAVILPIYSMTEHI